MGGTYTGSRVVFEKEKLELSLKEKLELNKSSFVDLFKKENGNFRYFLSGATANSYAYESLYLGNPSAYQTIIVGVNDICPDSNDSYRYLVFNDSSQEQIKQFREKSKINTYGETAPFMGEEVLKLLNSQKEEVSNYLTFGVDRIMVRYFNE
jgi:hypothetical protein